VAAGRVNLVDLQQSLNVDLSHIEAKVNELVKNDRSLTLVLGQLISRCRFCFTFLPVRCICIKDVVQHFTLSTYSISLH